MISKLAYKVLITAFVCLLYSGICSAHKANEAFFTFQKQDSTITVFAELPWSIRQVLIDYDSSLDESSNEKALLTSLKMYFDEKLILKDFAGKKLELLSFQFLPQQGHSHQSDFELIYFGTSLLSIDNKLFTSYFKNQKNYHQDLNTSIRYLTNSVNTRFYIGETQVNSLLGSFSLLSKIMLALLLSSVLTFCLLITKYKKPKTSRFHQTDIINNAF